MNTSFGTEFVLISSVRDPLFNLGLATNGRPYIHLATVKRGLKEYVAYLDEKLNRVWIEQIDPVSLKLTQIQDDNEWSDLKDFLYASGCLQIGINQDIRASEKYARLIGITK